jgi:nucleotide-binding universal stress UspA family protein
VSESASKLTRILVATDGSESANHAVEYAAHLARDSGADLIIANIVGGFGLPDAVFRSFTRAEHAWLKDLLTSQSGAILSAARDRARESGAGTIRLESRQGEAASELLEIARENHADLVVVGKRGTGRAAGLLLGSVSQKLASLAPLPVAVVP